MCDSYRFVQYKLHILLYFTPYDMTHQYELILAHIALYDTYQILDNIGSYGVNYVHTYQYFFGACLLAFDIRACSEWMHVKPHFEHMIWIDYQLKSY